MQHEFDKASIADFFVTRRTPPWRPISSRELAQVLGVSLQSLANWRVRKTGPEPEPMRRGRGNKIYYRPDKVLSWLLEDRESWEFSRDWLLNRNLDVLGGLDRESTAWMIEGLDDML